MTTTTSESIAAAVAPVMRGIDAQIATMGSPSWYVINKKAEGESEIRIYEDIGTYGVTAKQFADDLEEITASKIHVRLNTYGGEAFDGIAIHNALKAHPAQIVIHIDGIAASAGSVIAMAGDEVRMANNAFLMIHEARGGVMGEADDMRGYADMLDKLNDAIANVYQARAGGTRKYWREKMAEESWFSADEAKEEGLADSVDEPNKAAKNRFDFRVLNHAPDAARKVWARQQQGVALEHGKTILAGTTESPNNPPEGPQRSDPSTASLQEVSLMSDTTQAPPALNPAAPSNQQQEPPKAIDAAEKRQQEIERLKGLTAEAQHENGRQKGITEGRAEQVERMKSILAVCPGKPQMAIDAFLSGQAPQAVKLAFDESAKVEAAAKLREQEKDLEIARWQQLAATGGFANGIPSGPSSEEGGAAIAGIEPKAQAEAEWDHKPAVRRGFTSKENYVAYRSRELSGGIQYVAGSAN